MLSGRLAALTLGLISAASAACSLIYSTDGLSGQAVPDASPPLAAETGAGDSSTAEASSSSDGATDALADADATDDFGLIGEWHFDETSGYTAKDTSGYGRHAALSGGVGFVPNGTLGGAVEFDGGGAVRVVGLDAPTFPRSGTLSVHYSRNVDPATNGRNIFDFYSTDRPPHLFLRDVDNGSMQAVFQSWDAGYLFVSTFADPGNLWRHVVIVWDEAKGSGSVWVDGALLKDGATVTPFAPTGQEFTLGRFFIGRIDELRLYNRPLTAEEVTTIP